MCSNQSGSARVNFTHSVLSFSFSLIPGNLKVAKQHGGDVAPKQVAYLWAKSLGGDSAVKLLQKFNLLDEAIEYAADNGAFEFAFELCRLGMKSKLPQVQHKYAQQLDDEGQAEQAEQHYLQSGHAADAVAM